MHQNIVNLKILKSKLFNLAEKKWRADVKSKPKLRNYEMFKTDLQPANYLQSFMPKLKRSLFAQFRTGVAHRNWSLPLNQGSYIKNLQKTQCRRMNMSGLQYEFSRR